MPTYKTRELEDALKDKGFRLDRSTDDKIYYLWHQGKKTSVHTKISHGRGEDIGLRLQSMIQNQLHLDTTAQFRQFIEGDMDAAAYIKHLRDKNVIQDPLQPRARVKLRHASGSTGAIVSIDGKGVTAVVAWDTGPSSGKRSSHPVNQLQRVQPQQR